MLTQTGNEKFFPIVQQRIVDGSSAKIHTSYEHPFFPRFNVVPNRSNRFAGHPASSDCQGNASTTGAQTTAGNCLGRAFAQSSTSHLQTRYCPISKSNVARRS